jgi:hypothetical protein
MKSYAPSKPQPAPSGGPRVHHATGQLLRRGASQHSGYGMVAVDAALARGDLDQTYGGARGSQIHRETPQVSCPERVRLTWRSRSVRTELRNESGGSRRLCVSGRAIEPIPHRPMPRITTGRSGALSPFLHVAGDHVRGDGQGKDDASRETPAFGNIRSMAGFRYPLRSPTGHYLGEFVAPCRTGRRATRLRTRRAAGSVS